MSVDWESRSTKRMTAVDPEDQLAKVDDILTAARVDGPDVFLDCLDTYDRWNAAAHGVQDLAIKEVARRLPDHIKLLDAMPWRCNCYLQVVVDGGVVNTVTKNVNHRLARFVDKRTTQQFSLLPGNIDSVEFNGRIAIRSSIEPFLIARWPTTRAERNHCVPNQSMVERVRRVYEHVPSVQRRLLHEVWLEEHGYDVPDELEWIYACRAGTSTFYYWGDHFNDDHVWHRDNYSERIRPDFSNVIGTSVMRHREAFKYNAFGLVDMIGNVDELIQHGGLIGGNLSWCYRDFSDEPYHRVFPSTEQSLVSIRPVIRFKRRTG